MNAPLQGTAADLIKLAMVALDRALHPYGCHKKTYHSKVLIQVHDELLLECPKEEVEEVKDITKSSMEKALKLSIPLVVNLAVGKNWMDLKGG